MLWYEKVLPTLLPFAIISNVLIHSGYMDAITKHLTKYFRLFLPVSGEGVFILCSGFLFGFPMGSKNCAELLKANKIHPKEAEILFYITNNISPVFIGSYILLQQLQLKGMFGISIFILYGPALILGMLLLRRKKEEKRQKKTASPSQITFKIIDAAIMNGFETLVRIGGYIMLFSILISLVEKLPLPKPVLILLENVLEITNGINCLANTNWNIQTKYILAMVATAFGGLSGIAQTSSMVKGTSLSMKRYCLVKLLLTLCTFLLAVTVSLFLL